MTNERKDRIILSAQGKTMSDMSACADEKGFFDCETYACAFNHNGQCRYAAVEEEMPVVTEEDGCLSGIIDADD